MHRRRVLAMTLMPGLWWAARGYAAQPRSVRSEVESLLASIEASGCSFNRNGTWHDAKAAIARAQADQSSPIVTTIEPMAPWYPAEDYHQKYWERVGDRNPYCMAVIPPKLAKLRKGFAERIGA